MVSSFSRSENVMFSRPFWLLTARAARWVVAFSLARELS